MHTSSDRGACIIAAAVLERDLEQIIISRFENNDKDTVAALLDRDGALATFFSKIYLAYAMGLIDSAILNDLDIIRRVRNAFAHSAVPLDFSAAEIKRELLKFQYHPNNDIYNKLIPNPTTGREIFLRAILVLMGVVVTKSEEI